MTYSALPGRRTCQIAALGLLLAWNAGAEPLSDSLAGRSPVERFGTLPTPYTGFLMRNNILDPLDLGVNNYQTHAGESKGIGYSCDVGFIDLDHVRDASDRTAYLYGLFLKALRSGQSEVSFPGYDGAAVFRVQFKRELTTDELFNESPTIALGLARQYAFLVLTWHEVLTWFGYRTFFLFPEQVSAFTYEDTVSNLLGTMVAADALTMRDVDYDTAATRALAHTLGSLHMQSINTTLAAMDRVKDVWWDSGSGWPRNRFVKRRSLDIGLNGQPITPWLVPDLPGCPEAKPLPLKPFDIADLPGRRFADFEEGYITPGMRSFWEQAFPDGRPTVDGKPITEIHVREHLAAVMAEVDRQVLREFGEHADRPEP